MHVEAITDAAAFLREAGDLLAADPVAGTVPATMAQRFIDHPGSQHDGDWFAVLRERVGGRAVGAAMRTPPHPANLLAMPEPAARALARWTADRGETVDRVNGEEALVRAFADELGVAARVVERTRQWEVRRVVPPPPAPGRLRVATRDDLELATRWYADFGRAAAEQAGHETTHGNHPSEQDMLRRVDSGTTWLWCDDAGRPVHLTGVNPPSLGVCRLGPVYTPVEERGRGWAASAVAELSARTLAAGHRVCLFTDLANPTSNAIYRRLGFAPVTDTVDLVIDRAAG